jgi:RNA polymerase sigma factor (sigma-70 family)
MTTGQPNRVLTRLHRAALLQENGGLTDTLLLERFLTRRDEAAFEVLVRRHGGMVLGVCRRLLGNTADADDAFQATFLVFVRRAASVVPGSRVGPWLHGVARRTALKARAAAARRRRAEQEAGRGRPRTTPPADTGGDLRPLLDEELGRLAEKYRAPLVLCLLQGRSRKDAAGLLGWSEGTLSGRLARAKELLGARLRRRGVALTAPALAGTLAGAEVPPGLALATAKAAASLIGPDASGAIPAPVIALTEEVSKAMLTSKLKAAAGVCVLVAGIGFGAGAAAWPYGPPGSGPAPADGYSGVKTAAPAEKRAEAKPPAYVIEPPDILLVEYAPRDGADPVKIVGQRLVRPDGTLSLGQLGSVHVSGRTLEEARGAIAEHLASRLDGFDPKKLTVDVVAHNSKVFYVITEGAEGGEQVYRFPLSGDETVLDAVAGVKGALIGLHQKSISIARLSGKGEVPRVFPVDWAAIIRRGETATNYQLWPGDRVYIKGPAPQKPEGSRRTDAVPATDEDAVRELEAVLKALREARSREEQRRVVEDLDVLAKRWRERLNRPGGAGRPGADRGERP